MTRYATGSAALVLALLACDGDTAGPDLALRHVTGASTDPLAAVVEVTNLGTRAVGPVDLAVVDVRFDGARVPDAVARILPGRIPTLGPESSQEVRVELEPAQLSSPGTYRVRVRAIAAGRSAAADIDLELPPAEPAATTIALDAPATARQGDVTIIHVDARDADGASLPTDVVSWRVEPADAGLAVDARFVAYRTGDARVVAVSGSAADSVLISVTARAVQPITFTEVGVGIVQERYTSDLWVHGTHAYTGTWGVRSSGGSSRSGNTLNVWDVSDPAAPSLVHELTVDARTVNDVKVSADGGLGAITHEGSDDGLNGVTLLDLSDPAHPVEITRYTTGLTSGVHNLWIDDDHLYVVADGASGGLRILDISDPTDPFEVAAFSAGESFLHDVFVRDGLAFLSHWDAGLVILDVGHGIAGGSPSAPVEVSRIRTAGGQTHNAWYWPEAGYVFVGEEDVGTPGRMHVVDVSDLWHPREVATYAVPDATPHNFWLDEDGGILYAAWYERGIRAVDVSGELLGELELQGRERGAATYAGLQLNCPGGEATCAWAPQLHDGLVYVSDMNTGLHVLSPTAP